MRFDGKTTQRRVSKFSLDELSAVPKGAQAPAKMAIIKISANDKRDMLRNAIREAHNGPGVYTYIRDYDDDFIVFEYDLDNGVCTAYAQAYTLENSLATLVGAPVEVTDKTIYEAKDGSQTFFKCVAEATVAQYELDTGVVSAIAKTGAHDAAKVYNAIEDQVASTAAYFGKAATKTVAGEAHPASDFAYVPDATKPSTWKLPIFDASHVSAAVAALGKGYRGKKVSIPDADRVKVLNAVRAAYSEHYPDKTELPNELKKSEVSSMSENTDTGGQSELDVLKAQNAELEVLAKMTDAEKAYMSNMSDADKKAYMAMSAEDRAKAMKATKAADESFVDASTGQTIAKSDVGETAYSLMKAQSERLAKLEDDKAMAEALELVKSLCPDLPGKPEEKAGMLRKCKTAMTAEDFGVLEKALKAGNAAMVTRKTAAGHDQDTGGEQTDSARATYQKGLQQIMSDQRLSKTAAMQTPEGLALAKTYREAVEE